MKKQIILGCLIAISVISYSQNSNPWPTTGNVGIGTASPAFALDVSTSNYLSGIRLTQTGSGAAGLELRNTTAGGRRWGMFSLGNGDAGLAGNFAIYDLTSGTNRFFIDGTNGTGNVGIGTMIPAFKLDVNGNVNTNGILTIGSNFILNSTGTFKNNAWAGTGSRLIMSDASGNLSALNQGTSTQVLYGNGTWGNLPATSFTASGSDLNLPTGKLGIGITPSAPLDVVGDANVRGNVRSTNLAGTGERIVVADANGNLKTIGGGSNGGACVNAMPWCLGGNYPAGTTLPYNNIGTCNNVPFILKSNDVQSVFIQPNSFVGVGLNNANPTAALDVSDGSISNSYHIRIFGNANGDIISNTHLKLAYDPGKVFEIMEGGGTNRMYINTSGNVGFGDNSTAAPNGAKVNVNVTNIASNAFEVYNTTTSKAEFRVKSTGFVYSREVNVQLTAFPDYVFANNYKLQSLESLESYIKTNKHLPNVPTAKEIEKNGANLGELAKIQMEKIEELTLYIIELQKRIRALEEKNNK